MRFDPNHITPNVSISIDGTNFGSFTAGPPAYYPRYSVNLEFLRAVYNGRSLVLDDGHDVLRFPLVSSTAAQNLERCSRAIGITTAMHAPIPAPGPAALYAPPQRPDERSAHIPLERNNGIFWLWASVNGSQRTKFVLDTGATNTTLPDWLADRLFAEGVLTPSDYVTHVRAKLADGSTVTAPLYRLRSITLNGVIVHNVECEVGGNGDPLIGQSLLSKFHSWSMDNAQQQLNVTWD